MARFTLRDETLGFVRFAALAMSMWEPTLAAAEPLTLRAAVERAYQSSAESKVARAQREASAARQQGARAGHLPRVGASAGYSWTSQPMLALGALVTQRSVEQGLNFNDIPATDNLHVAGTVEMPIYAGGGVTAAVQSAHAQTKSLMEQEQAVRRRVALQVAHLYFAALKMDAWTEAAEANRRALESALVVAEKRMQTGALLRSDVLDIRVRLGQAQDELLAARNARILLLQNLRKLIDMPDDAVMELSEAGTTLADPGPYRQSDGRLVDSPTEERLSLAGLASSKHPEVQSAEFAKRAAEADVKRAKSGYLPQASAVGTLAYDRGFRTGGDMVSYIAGVALRWDAFDGFATAAKVSEAKAQLRATEAQQRKVKRDLQLEALQAHVALGEARQRAATSAAMIAEAQESAEITRTRYEQGLVLTTQLLESESNLARARMRLAQARTDERTAAASLRVALGLELF